MSKHNSDDNPQGHDFLKNILSPPNKKNENTVNNDNNSVSSENTVSTVSESVDSAVLKESGESGSVDDVKDNDNTETSLIPDSPTENVDSEHNANSEDSVDSEHSEEIDKKSLINSKAASAPAFKKVEASKKDKESPQETEFEKVKPELSEMSDGDKIISKEKRKKKVTQVTLSVLATFSLVFLSGVAYSVIQQGKTPDKPVVSQIEEDKVNILNTPQKSIMQQIAEQENPEFNRAIVDKDKTVVYSAESKLIHNNENSSSFNFNGYELINDNPCHTERATDFCYVAEIARDSGSSNEDEPTASEETVGSVYMFHNIFDSQFFNEFETPVKQNVDGFTYAATAQVKVAGNDAFAILLAQETGLGYGIVVRDEAERDNVLNAINAEDVQLDI